MKKVTFSLNGKQISIFLPDVIWKNIGTNLSENEKRRYLKQIAASPSQTLSGDNDQFYVHTVYQTGDVLFTLYTRDGKNLRICSSNIQEEPQLEITLSDATEEEIQTASGYFSALGLSDAEAVRDTMQEVIFKKTNRAPIEERDAEYKSPELSQDDIINITHEIIDNRKISPDHASLLPGGNKNLEDELSSILETQKQDLFDLTNSAFRSFDAETNPELVQYIHSSKAGIEKQRKEFEEEIEKNNHEISEAHRKTLSDTLPFEYLYSEFAKDFIQYNAIAALYNAARDYYKSIWNECKSNSDKLKSKINSFNQKFQGIVKINDNLELTPFLQTYEALKKHKIYKDKEQNNETLETIIAKLITRSTERGSSYGIPRAFTCIKKRLEALNAIPYYDPVSRQHKTVILINPVNYSRIGKTEFSFNQSYFKELAQLHAEKSKQISNDALEAIDATAKAAIKHLDAEHERSMESLRKSCESAVNDIESMRALIEQKDTQLSQLRNLYNQLNQDDLITKQLNTIHERINKLNFPDNFPLKEQVSADLHKTKETVADVSDKASQFKSAIDNFKTQLADKNRLILNVVYNAKKEIIDLKEAEKQAGDLKDANTELLKAINQNHTELDNIYQQLKPILAALDIIEHYSTIQAMKQTFISDLVDKKLALQSGQPKQDLLDNIMAAKTFYNETAAKYQKFLSDAANKFDYAGNRSMLESSSSIFSNTSQAVLSEDIPAFIQGAPAELRRKLDISQGDTNDLLICQILANTILNFNYWKDIQSGPTEKMVAINYSEATVPRDIAHLSMLLASTKFDNWANNPKEARRLLEALKHDATKKNKGNPKVEDLLDIIRNINHETTPVLLRNTIIKSFGDKLLQDRSIIHPRQLDNLEIIKTPTFWERHPDARKVIIGAVIGAVVGLLITATVLFLPYLLPAVFGATLGGIVASIIATGTLAPIVLGVSLLFSSIGALIGRAVGRKNVPTEPVKIQHDHQNDVRLQFDENVPDIEIPDFTFKDSEMELAQPEPLPVISTNPFDAPPYNQPAGTRLFATAKTTINADAFLREFGQNFINEYKKVYTTPKDAINAQIMVNYFINGMGDSSGDTYFRDILLSQDGICINAVRTTLGNEKFKSFDINLLNTYPKFKAFVDLQKQALGKEDLPSTKTPRQ